MKLKGVFLEYSFLIKYFCYWFSSIILSLKVDMMIYWNNIWLWIRNWINYHGVGKVVVQFCQICFSIFYRVSVDSLLLWSNLISYLTFNSITQWNLSLLSVLHAFHLNTVKKLCIIKSTNLIIWVAFSSKNPLKSPRFTHM